MQQSGQVGQKKLYYLYYLYYYTDYTSLENSLLLIPGTPNGTDWDYSRLFRLPLRRYSKQPEQYYQMLFAFTRADLIYLFYV